jgi:hypothetical protein
MYWAHAAASRVPPFPDGDATTAKLHYVLAETDFPGIQMDEFETV